MTLLLTCGQAHSRYEAAHALLVSAGLAEITPPLAAVTTDGPAGWAEPHALGRLEALDADQPGLRFVLVYAAPQAVLAQSLQGRGASADVVGDVLAGWLAAHDDLLRFANRHPDRCVLVDAACARHAPHAFIAHVADFLQVPLQAAAEPAGAEDDAIDGLACALAQVLVQGRRDISSMLLELQSQATLDPATLGLAEAERALAWQQFAELLAERQALRETADGLVAQLAAADRNAAQLALKAEQADKLAAERAVQLERSSRAHDEQARQAAERERQQAQDHQRASQVAAARLAEEGQRAAAARQECELLLLQLHQVQEELEATFLKSKAMAEAHDAAQAEGKSLQGQLAQSRLLAEQSGAELAKLLAERDQHAAAAKRQQAQIDALKQEAEKLKADHQTALAAQARQTAQAQADHKALQGKLAESSRVADERSVELTKLRAERDQLAAATQMHKSQAEALKQEADRQKAELQRRPDPAPLQAQLAEATQENELLLLQLHHVQEELEHYYLQHRDLAARSAADAPLLRFLRGQWQAAQPEELVIDLRCDVPGSNWHEVEPDGRWAGPASTSQLRWPALRPGTYNLALDIVDAMHPEILQGTELHLNGQRIQTELIFDGFPALLTGNVTVPELPQGLWELELRFPRLMAPSERGEPDERLLALRLRSIRVTYLEAA